MFKPPTRISIVGYGRFGKVLHRLLKDEFAVTIFQRHEVIDQREFTDTTVVAKTLSEVYQNDVVFFAVPIESFEQVIAEHQKFFTKKHLLIDVLSVKLYPQKIFTDMLKNTQTQALLTHPMFGPDSSRQGFTGLPLIMDKFLANDDAYTFWKKKFSERGLRVIEMSADEHDRLAADSQGLTHFIGRLLDEYGMNSTAIDSLGAKKLLEVKEQMCHDTWQLFHNLQHFNPYTKMMRVKLGQHFDELHVRLLPSQIQPNFLTIGIQGGRGSFNEEAIRYLMARKGITNYHIKYLYTSEQVLRALHEGDIDQAQFAIHNSAGGMVDESIQAMAKYRFRILDQFAIKILHTLMIRGDAAFSEVTTIMTHPQVLAQCKESLRQKYPQLQQTSGVGKMVDHALVAKHLSEKKVPKHIATMGSKVLAELYGLKIVEENLQDLAENYTTFLLADRG